MYTAELIPIPNADPNEVPWFKPNENPLTDSEIAHVQYLCGGCSATIANLPYMVGLSELLNNHEPIKNFDADLLAIVCSDCDMFNELPNRDEAPVQLNIDVNLAHLLAESEQTKPPAEFDPEGHSIDPEVHLLNRWDEIYELSYENLVGLSMCLSDAALRTSPPRISYDHFIYWGWTAAYITEHPLSSTPQFKELIREYLSLVHFMLFKLRYIYSKLFYSGAGLHTNVDGRDITWEEAFRVLEWGNPSIQHLPVLPDRYAASTGFATLEGLINIHGDNLSAENGTLVSEVSSPWHPHRSSIKGEHTYHDKLQIWR